jgi:hypothetical protein
MDYFVSIENIPYHRWQLELLIESFKIHGLQDNLLVGIVDNKDKQYSLFCKNLLEHKRKFVCEDYGSFKRYKKLNKPYGILSAMTNGLIEQPFAILHPDMILYKPISIEKNSIGNFFFSIEQENVDLKKRLSPYLTDLLKNRVDNIDDITWLNTGNFCIFNNVSAIFFKRVMYYMEKFLQEHPDWEDINDAAWLMAFYEQYELSSFQGKFYECTLKHDIEKIQSACVIHYEHGFPPHFHKKQYTYPKNMQFSLNALDPIDTICQYDGTTAMQFMNQVAKKYKSQFYERKNKPMKIESELIEPKI